jgi:hypothetical protein
MGSHLDLCLYLLVSLPKILISFSKLEMVVVIYRHIGKDFDLKSGSHPAQNLQKRGPVFVIGHNGAAFVAPGERSI